MIETALLILLLIAVVILIYLTINKKPSNEIVEWLKSTNTRIEHQSRSFNEKLDATSRAIGEFSEIGRSMKDLQDFLRSPKLRGNIGEAVLKDMLSQFLPKQTFKLQYTFKTGEKVDAAIFTSGGIIPIDSKFPMENFRKMINDISFKKLFILDVKKHIEDISKKYILPQEGTTDYALMYIPSESIYYEIANNEELFEYSAKRRILPVSPTTFYAYLKAILMSFEGQKIETRAKEILANLRAIQKDYEKVDESLNVLQKHLVNAYNMMGNVFDGFGKLGQKITSTQNLDDGAKRSIE